MVALYSTMGSYWSNWCVRKWGVAPFAPKFRMERVSPYGTGVVSERAELSRSAAPMDATLPFSLMSMTSVVSYSAFRAVSHQGGNVLITDVVSNSAKHQPDPPLVWTVQIDVKLTSEYTLAIQAENTPWPNISKTDYKLSSFKGYTAHISKGEYWTEYSVFKIPTSVSVSVFENIGYRFGISVYRLTTNLHGIRNRTFIL